MAGDDPNSGNWQPVAEFNRQDADVSAYFLSQNAVQYIAPVYDPLFSATRPLTLAGAKTHYASTYLVNPMLCADQYVMCNPTTSTCTSPSGLYGTQTALSSGRLGLNDAQVATAWRIWIALNEVGIWHSVEALGVGALYANLHILSTLVSTSLPDTQWHIEVLGWFQTNLAQLQNLILEYAHKPANLPATYIVTSPNGLQPILGQLTQGNIDAYQSMCRNQLIRSDGEVQNFSFLGVAIIACVSVFLMLQSLLLPCCLQLGKKHKGWTSVGKRSRQADDKLHLLRIALSTGASGGAAARHWEEGVWDVPVERGESRVARPDVEDGLTSYDGAKGEWVALQRGR
jgi:hypothetical protein